MTRLIRLAVVAAMPVAVLSAASACAQNYPVKPVRFVVPFVAGGPTDIQGRLLGEKLGQRLGQQFLIDNRGGANGNIGMDITAKSPPDGYTIVIATVGTWAVNPSLYKSMPYDPVRDFAPIMQVSGSPGVLVVHPSVPVKSVKELIALARSKPGKLDYGSSGVGGFGHISGALFCLMTKTEMVHIPYKSSAPSLTDLIAGQIQVLFNNAIATVPFVKSGQTRALAVTSLKRMAALPALPTLDESGVKGYDNSSWSAVGAPAGTPKEIIAKLNSELNAILKLPDVMEKNAAVGADAVGGTPEQFGDYLKSEIAKFARVVKEAKISAQ
ncbi:MAG: tripartite tricarboxylate transporter substrate binding protein [Betaproteobacteria bacterium]|nr:tripartite tricarboxylate transporter substrate binding protein [Betaproteobacteria bacterium]